MRGIQVTGHRGARDLAPENTLAGFHLAHELGCHAVELDVHLTRDGELVVIHDALLDRTTNGSGPVAEATLEEIRALDAGDGERVPTLQEVIDLVAPTGMMLQIELKGAGTEEPAAAVVARTGMTDRVRFTSFFHHRVLGAREVLERISAGAAAGISTGVLMNSNPVEPLAILDASRADSIHVKWERLDDRLVRAVHRGAKLVVAMGRIVETAVIDHLVELDVDVIGSDRPDLVIERLKRRGRYSPPA